MNACTILGSKSKLSMHCQECVSHLYVTWAWLPKSHAGGYDGRARIYSIHRHGFKEFRQVNKVPHAG